MMSSESICCNLIVVLACIGFSSVAAAYSPAGPIPCHAFTGANESWFQYPELATVGNYTIHALLQKPDLGIAISGGGFRAATVGLGYLRALHMLNVSAAARYLTSNSGGSWLNAAFSFQDSVPLDTFLGTYIPPQQLGLQQLQQGSFAQGSFAAAIANAGILIPGATEAVEAAVRTILPGDPDKVGAWSQAVGQAFLQPYNLNSDASTFTAAGTVGSVHQALQNLPKEVAVYTYSPTGGTTIGNESRPFPVMLGSILLPDTPLGFYGIEFTPLYVGSPPFFNDTQPPIGGGMVDPVGFNTPPPNPKPTIPAPILQAFADTAATVTGHNNGTLMTNQSAPAATSSTASSDSSLSSTRSANGLNSSYSYGNSNSSSRSRSTSEQLMRLEPLLLQAQPDYLVPLKVVVGISSSFITNMLRPQGRITRELTGTEVLNYWNQIDFTGKRLPFADGGSADNLAITPLLRRRVRKIIMAIAASQNISNTGPADWASYQWDIAALFGACPPTGPGYDEQDNGTIVGIPVDLFNRKLQVFPTEGYQQLYDALKARTAAGGPTYHLATYDVLTNPYQAVFGGWKVEVLWVVNQQQINWEQALPTPVQQVLARSRGQQQDGGFLQNLEQGFQDLLSQAGIDSGKLGLEGYPFIDTGKANYSPGLTQLLSQQATWQMLKLQQQIQQLLNSTNASMQPV